MLKNYFRIALRNLLKYKGYSFINILGLAIGITCCLLILIYVQDELSFDRHNKKIDRIYRITLSAAIGGSEFNGAVTTARLAPALLNDYPEVEAAVRIENFGFPVFRYKDKVFSEERVFSVDASYFNIFTTTFLKGSPENALTEPNTIVLTETSARKYFGKEDPMGKFLNADKRRDYKVTGVIKDPPASSHFHFDFLGSIASYPRIEKEGWVDNNVYTYIVLREGTNPKEFSEKLQGLVHKYVAPVLEQALGATFEQLKTKGAHYDYKLQPLGEIHLKSELGAEIEPNGSMQYVYIFSFVAFGILLIACINFINLSTARSSNRSKEIGIRKTLGAYRTQLIKQFLVETIITAFISVLVAVILIEIFLPLFNTLVGRNLEFSYFRDIRTIPLLAVLAIIVGLMAGIYPAFYLSFFDPVRLFKKGVAGKGRSYMRNILVIAQFSISIILLIGTFIVFAQLDYIKNKKLGFEKDQVIIIQKTDDVLQHGPAFLEELHRTPGVINASNSRTVIGKPFGNTTFKLPDAGGNENHIISVTRTDMDYVDTYRMKMAEGRFFSKDFPSDSVGLVINESAARTLGISGNAVGKKLISQNPQFSNRLVIGVVKDFHFASLHQAIQPLVIALYNKDESYGRYITVRLSPGDYKHKIENIKAVWKKFADQQDFEYYFLDDDFNRLYKAEEMTSTISTVFAFLAIFTACLGLLGLAAFTIEQRTKEVGIRKVLGASASGIVILLAKEFAKWVLIANLIAWPVSYFIMGKWLEEFAYRINIPLWSFITAGLCALVIAVITVSYQAVKAAVANPVRVLKYE